MVLWRISNHETLDGRGGLVTSARWHSEGQPIVYLSETPSGALVEVLVHLELDYSKLPTSYKLLKVEAPDDVAMDLLPESELALDWREDPTVTQAAGDAWLTPARRALLKVPSAIVPETFNLLLNPRSAEAARLHVLWHREYPWDRRFF